MKKWLFAALFALALPVMAATSPALQPRASFVDLSGNPCAGCYLYSYAAGTSNLLPTYTDSTGTAQNTDPIQLDAAGTASVWVSDASYKFSLVDRNGTVLWTEDNVQAPMQQQSGGGFLPLAGGTMLGNILMNGFNVTGAGEVTGKVTDAVVHASQFSGTDACVKINAAISSLPATGGVVDARGFGAGRQTVAVTCDSSTAQDGSKPVTLILSPATVFVPASASLTVLEMEPNTIVIGLTVDTSGVSGYTGNAVEFNRFYDGNENEVTRLENFNLKGAIDQGNGISYDPPSGAVFTSVTDGTITGFKNAIYLNASAGFVNSNVFQNISDIGSTNCLNLDHADGNQFMNINCEGNSNAASVYGILGVASSDNVFSAVNLWDYTTTNPISLDSASQRNSISGLASAYATQFPGNQAPVNSEEWITGTGGSGNPLEYSYSGFQFLSGNADGTSPTPENRGITANTYTGGGTGGAFDFWIASNYTDSAFNFIDSKSSTTMFSLTSTAANFNVPVTLTTVKSATSLATDANGKIVDGGDRYWHSAGCAFSGDTNGATCDLAMTIPNGGFPDTNYEIQCTAYQANATNNSAGYAMVKSGTKTATGFTLLLVEDWGNNAGAGNSWPEVDCHAHHE